MKVLRLSWQNIHSLRCRTPEFIDLEAPPFLGSGLFTISGPTGAGKSTLLDVICLALYGRTPRFGDSASPAEHVMSWGTGDCMAEVDYQIGERRYRSRWSCRRARGKTDGKLQSPQMQVVRVDVSPEETLHTLSRDVQAFNEGEIGLKFEHFRRAILLAQGQFAEFLKGKSENRRDILERLTDTSIYLKLSRAVYRRADTLAQGLAELRKQRAEAADHVLAPEAVATLTREMAEGQSHLDALAEERTAVVLERQRLDELERLIREAEAALADARTLEEALATRAMDWAALSRHDALSPLADVLANHARDGAAQERLRLEIEAGAERRPAMVSAVTSAETALRAQSIARDTLRGERSTSLPRWEAAQRLDDQLDAHRETHQTRLTELRAARHTTTQAETRRAAGQTAFDAESTRREERQLWLDAHAADAALPERLSGLTEAWRGAESGVGRIPALAREVVAAEQVADQKRALAATAERVRLQSEGRQSAAAEAERAALSARDAVADGQTLDTLASQRARHLEALAEVEHAQATGETRAECCRRLRALDAESTELEAQAAASLLKHERAAVFVSARREVVEALRAQHRAEVQVQSLAAHREALVDGAPCPLCGALEHPLAGTAAPDTETTERKIAAADSELTAAQGALQAVTVEQAAQNTRRATLAPRRDEVLSRWPKGPTTATGQLVGPTASTPAGQVELPMASGASPATFDAAAWPKTSAALAEQAAELRQRAAEVAERLPRLRAAQGHADTAVQAARAAERAHTDAERAAHPAAESAREAEAAMERAKEAVASATVDAEETLAAVETALHSVDPSKATPEAVAPNAPPPARLAAAKHRLDTLAARAEAWKRAQDEQIGSARKLAELDGKRAAATAERDLSRQHEKTIEAAIEKLTEAAQQLAEQRAEHLAPELKPADERRRMDTALEQASARVEANQKALTTAQQAVSTLDHLQADRDTRWHALTEALAQAEASCAAHPAAEGKGIATLQAERLPAVRAIALRQDQTELNTRLQAALGRHADRTADRARVAETRTTALDREALAERDTALASSAAQIQADLDERRLGRSRHLEALERIRACDLAMGERGVLAQRWEKLNALIGSADGKKFATFAQTLNLRHLLRRGNTHLARISGRYRMAAGEDLHIEIEDLWQNGDQRSVESLSGGETFLVSLALALGLADMASREVRIDSLFIDEGFGTLDPDVLEDVISALESQVFSGKLVGVISHVDGLKERIPTGVRVRPMGDGQSRVDIEG